MFLLTPGSTPPEGETPFFSLRWRQDRMAGGPSLVELRDL